MKWRWTSCNWVEMFQSILKKIWNPQCWICRNKSSYRWDLCWSCLTQLHRLSQTKHGLFQYDPLLTKMIREGRVRWKKKTANFLWRICRRKGILQKWQKFRPHKIYWLPQGDPREVTALEYFARMVAKELGVPAELGFRKISSGHQHTKNRTHRMDVDLLFEPLHQMVPERILLFDDVESTGTSLDQCKYLLKRLGAKRVRSFVLVVNVMEGFEGQGGQSEQKSEEVEPFLLQLFV